MLQRLRDLLRSLPSVSPLTLLTLLRNPRETPALQAAVVRLHREVRGGPLPAITPEKLLDQRGAYTLRLGDGVEVNEIEDFLLLKLVAMLQPRVVFEIGTFIGTRTAMLASQSPPDVRIYTLDLPPDAEPPSGATDLHMIERSRSELGRRFRGTRFEASITQLLGDSRQLDTTPYRGRVDLVYVDGSHSYAYVVNDTQKALEMIRPGGVVVWDDAASQRSEYGTAAYLAELRRRGYPVYRLGADWRDAVRTRAVLRATPEVIERLARDPLG